MRRRRAPVAAAIALVAAAACSSYGGTSGAIADGGADAATDAPSADAPDMDASDGASTACDGAIRVHDDFTSGIGAVWSPITQGPASLVAAAALAGGATPTSPPLALAASTDFGDAGGSMVSGVAALHFARTVVASSIHLTHTISVVQQQGAYGEIGCVLAVGAPDSQNAQVAVLLLVTPSGSFYARTSPTGFDAATPPDILVSQFTNGAWYDVDVNVDVGTSLAGTLAMKPHGTTATPATVSFGPTPLPDGANVFDVRCGISYADNAGELASTRLDVALDDIDIVVCPR